MTATNEGIILTVPDTEQRMPLCVVLFNPADECLDFVPLADVPALELKAMLSKYIRFRGATEVQA